MASLYIHIPFCEKKCFYCSFVVSVGQRDRIDEYLAALRKEALLYKGRKLRTVYVGGGTPSFLNNAQIQELFKIIRGHFDCRDVLETTFEINPENIDEEKAKLLREEGVSRVSCGVQSFSPDQLKFLGRNHSATRSTEAIGILKRAGFTNINADLMFSLPKQRKEDIGFDIQAFKALQCQHISLYALTLDENSRFFTRKLALPDLDTQAQQYELVTRLIEEAGYSQYEVSNFASPGFESKHNINYWEDGEYIGLGVGAHSYLRNRRFWNTSNIFDYIKRSKTGVPVKEKEEILTQEEQFKTAFLFGLRMNKGVCLKTLEKKYSQQWDEKARNTVDELIKEGYILYEKDFYKVTDRGRLVLDEICERLI